MKIMTYPISGLLHLTAAREIVNACTDHVIEPAIQRDRTGDDGRRLETMKVVAVDAPRFVITTGRTGAALDWFRM